MLLQTVGDLWLGSGSAGPRKFFMNNEPGVYLDFTQQPSLYQDNLAATPLTLPDQSIGLAADRSRVRSPITVAAAVQATLGLRPKWGWMPKTGRRNLLTYSEQFDNAAWAKTNATVTANAAVAPDGMMTADKLVGSVSALANRNCCVIQSATFTAGADYTLTFDSASAETPHVVICVDNSGGVQLSVAVNLSTGVATAFNYAGVSADPTDAITVGPIANGYRKITLLFRNQGYSNIRISSSVSQPTSTGGFWWNADGDGTSGILIWGAQLELGSIATAYQRVTNAYDVTEAGVPSYGYIRPDLFDDVLTVTAPAAQSGDVMVFGRRGSWLETGVAYGSGAAVAIGPTTMTGLPAGLLQAVQGPVSDISGGLVGVLAIGRTLTEAERAAAIAYYKARGAAGWLVAGAELVTNGTFTTDIAGWTQTGSGSAVWDASGAIACSDVGGADCNVAGAITTVIGRQYKVSWTVRSSNGYWLVRIRNQLDFQFVGFGTGTFSGIFTASTVSNTVNLLAADTNSTTVFDNISVRELTVTP